jgi:hypothetical protein
MCRFRTKATKVAYVFRRSIKVVQQSFHTMHSRGHNIGTINGRKLKAIKARWPPVEWHISNLMQFRQVAQQLRFQVLTVSSMNVSLFWNVAPYSLVDTDRHFRGAYCLYHQGSKLVWNVGQYLPDDMAQHPRRPPSSVQKLPRGASSDTCHKPILFTKYGNKAKNLNNTGYVLVAVK